MNHSAQNFLHACKTKYRQPVQVAIKLTKEMEQDNTQMLTGKLALKEHRQPENWKEKGNIINFLL